MSVLKSIAKTLAAQTVVGLAVNAIEKNVIEPVKDKVKKVIKARRNNDDQ